MEENGCRAYAVEYSTLSPLKVMKLKEIDKVI